LALSDHRPLDNRCHFIGMTCVASLAFWRPTHNAAQVVDECERYKALHKRVVYHTPKSYLFFLELYKSLYLRRLGEIQVEEARVSSGLDKLHQVGGCTRWPCPCSTYVALLRRWQRLQLLCR
jgi:hypothetical protein